MGQLDRWKAIPIDRRLELAEVTANGETTRGVVACPGIVIIDESDLHLRFSPGGRPGWQPIHVPSGGAVCGWLTDEDDIPILAGLYGRLGNWDRPYPQITTDFRMWSMYGEFCVRLSEVGVPMINPHLAGIPASTG